MKWIRKKLNTVTDYSYLYTSPPFVNHFDTYTLNTFQIYELMEEERDPFWKDSLLTQSHFPPTPLHINSQMK